MKEKISDKLKREFDAYLNGFVSADYFRNGIDQALDEYADWKIKECLPEKTTKPMTLSEHEELYNTGLEKGWNACIDQILLNKNNK